MAECSRQKEQHMQKNLDVVGKSQRFVTSLGCMGPKWLQAPHEPPEIE